MTRTESIHALEDKSYIWDILVIGGGATGLGCALDAASRGHRTLLVESDDFAKGTSSRSTKLVHGGVRYLRQGNISLVLEALKERGLLCRNAPHLVHPLAFIVPAYSWWEGPFYGIGMKLYDSMAGQLGLSPSKFLSREETLQYLPNLEPEGLQRGILYYDGQFDDSRLAINLAQTITEQGGVVVNYAKVRELHKKGDLICGAEIEDCESGQTHTVRARCVINATGVFSDSILQMDDQHSPKIIQASRGTHLILPREFLPGNHAIMVPHTTDGRVLFALPWHNKTLVGTTDVETNHILREPVPTPEEIQFILENASRYLQKEPTQSDILSAFAGLRPLIHHQGSHSTAALSRDHTLMISRSGLITITGGKWTTYRKMAQDTIDQAETIGGLASIPCKTEHLPIHGATTSTSQDSTHSYYGSDLANLMDYCATLTDGNALIHPDLPYLTGEIYWAARHEMARTVEDVLARRTRALLLDSQAAMEATPHVARHLATALNKDSTWIKQQIADFLRIAQHYTVTAASSEKVS
jgi:glycerol-3-phosphate dehydrogenase